MNISIDKQRIYPQKDCYNQLKVSVVHTFIRYEYPHQVIPGMGTHLCFKEDCVVWLESQHVIWILSDPLILGWMPQNMNFISFQTVNCHNETYESTLTSYKTTQILKCQQHHFAGRPCFGKSMTVCLLSILLMTHIGHILLLHKYTSNIN